MVNQASYPHADVDLLDNSASTPVVTNIMPLHVPVFFIFAQQGPVGIPVLDTFDGHSTRYGAYTFDERSPFFQHPTVFAKRAAGFQQVYLVRLADNTAETGSLVLEVSVTPVSMVQYQRNAYGVIINDASGNPLPQLASDGITQITQPGISLNWTTRQLVTGETINSLEPTTVLTGGVEVTTYPVMAIQSSSPGSNSSNTGFSLYYTTAFDTASVANSGAMLYNFAPVQKAMLTGIVGPVYDEYNSAVNGIALMDGAYDSDTAQYLDLKDIVRNQYPNGLPFKFYVYSANVGAVGTAILNVSPELVANNINNYTVNILSAQDASGNPYSHAQCTTNSAQVINQNVVLYMQGGTDGVLTKANLENLTIQYVSGEVYPQAADTFRYPFTHIYDSGYSLATKQSLLNIWSPSGGLGRDDVKITFSTQDVANIANTAAQDQSTGSALRAAILLHPESVLFGTEACRADIYQQCSTLNDTQVYTNIVPYTLDRLIKRCMYNGIDRIKGSPKGRPESEVSIFNVDSINWSPTTPDQDQLSWDTGLNYAQYCDTTTMFYADLRSVYPIDTSLLSDDVFVDYMIYLKHIAREQWTIFAGRNDPKTRMFGTVEDSINKACAYAFNNMINVTATVYQTAIDTGLGYQTTVELAVTGNMSDRVWKIIVPISRAA